jgi:hypothetical protein
VDTLIAREKATDDPRMKVALLARLVQRYLYLDRQDECMSTSIRTLAIAEPTKNDTLLGRAHLSIGVSFRDRQRGERRIEALTTSRSITLQARATASGWARPARRSPCCTNGSGTMMEPCATCGSAGVWHAPGDPLARNVSMLARVYLDRVNSIPPSFIPEGGHGQIRLVRIRGVRLFEWRARDGVCGTP